MSILPPGVHRVRVKNVLMPKPNEGYSPQLRIDFTDGGDGYMTWFASLGYTKEGFSLKRFEYEADQFKAMGWEPSEHNFDFESLQDPTTSPLFQWEGDIRVEVYKDKPQFKWIEGAGGGVQAERMEQSAQAGFMAKLRADLARAGKKVSTPAATAPRPAAPPLNTEPADDTIPF